MAQQKIYVKESSSIAVPLGLIFIVLKLVGVIDWAWIWVLCPFWIGFAIYFGVIAIGLAVAGFLLAGAWIIDKVNGR